MKLSRTKIVSIYNILSGFKGTYSKTFSMYLILNQKQLKNSLEEIKVLQESAQPSEEFKQARQKEVDLINEYVERDENNQPISLGKGSFKIKADGLEEYKEKHNKLIDETKDVKEEYHREFKARMESDPEFAASMKKMLDGDTYPEALYSVQDAAAALVASGVLGETQTEKQEKPKRGRPKATQD